MFVLLACLELLCQSHLFVWLHVVCMIYFLHFCTIIWRSNNVVEMEDGNITCTRSSTQFTSNICSSTDQRGITFCQRCPTKWRDPVRLGKRCFKRLAWFLLDNVCKRRLVRHWRKISIRNLIWFHGPHKPYHILWIRPVLDKISPLLVSHTGCRRLCSNIGSNLASEVCRLKLIAVLAQQFFEYGSDDKLYILIILIEFKP